MKLKKCKNINCGIMFTPERPMQTTHDYLCAIEYSKQLQAKKQDSEKRKAKKEFNENDRTVLLKLAQTVFNKYIRLRDKDLPCVSCGKQVKEGMAHASHFKPAGNYSQLRFDEYNVHKSCSKCNVFLSGNLDAYRIRIVERIGQEQLDRLDLPNSTKLWTVDELKEIIELYKRKIKELSV